MDNTNFDFKKIIKKKINDDVKPMLNQEGFILLPHGVFIREKAGLLQILYFKVQNTRLRPWAYFLPIYLPCIHMVNYGTCGNDIHYSLQSDNLYDGFGCIFISEDIEKCKQYEEYITKIISQFEGLLSGIKDAVLPEMDRISSLARFVDCLRKDRNIWGYNLRPCPNDRDIIAIAYQTGVRRVETLKTAAKKTDKLIPKSLLNIIFDVNIHDMSNQNADIWFYDYCNRVRDKFKLQRIYC